jgi:DNA-binding beta-propeller fold protein YncE
MSALHRTALLSLACFVLIPLQAAAWERGKVELFATLPAGARFPEGITANPRSGDIFVGTFDAGTPNNQLLRFDRRGRLEASRAFGTTPLLGLEFQRADGKVYIAAVGDFSATGSRIQRIPANFNAGTPIEEVALIPFVGPPAPRMVRNPDGSDDEIIFQATARVPNALTFDRAGNLYVSDSFQGAIFRIDNAAACTGGCVPSMVAHDPLLATAGFPPFGANGIAFNRDESALFIANTGDDRILRLDMKTGVVTVFAESINGADGIAFDDHGRLWVAANQADELVALNEDGLVIAKLGDFEGIRRNGSPDGLLFPASIVILDDEIFVTNLALPLTPTSGDEPEEKVTRYTISRVRARVPERDHGD